MTEASLGPAVRRLREDQRLSLRALAERTGFSASFLSQVENGQASPSISSMERIAVALGVTLGEFFQVAGGSTSPVTRAGARTIMESKWSHARLEALAGADGQLRLQPVLVTLEQGGSSGKKAYASTAEEFALVLSGTVELTMGETVQMLEEGDSVSMKPGAFRLWRNTGGEPARILIVSVRVA